MTVAATRLYQKFAVIQIVLRDCQL